jgi:hypothetical protein
VFSKYSRCLPFSKWLPKHGIKMATGRNFSISPINSGHHYLPTYQILMISGNVEFLPPFFYTVFWQPFWNYYYYYYYSLTPFFPRTTNLSTADLRNYRTQFHETLPRKERRKRIIIIIIIIIRNGAKTISLNYLPLYY